MDVRSPTERLQELLPQLFDSDRALGDRYLLFQLLPGIKVAIPLDLVWEATTLPATAITPIPQMPSCVLGWHNGRDRVYCVLGLAELLGLGMLSKIPQQYPTIVMQVPTTEQNPISDNNPRLLGITVNQILRTVTVNPEEMAPPIAEFPRSVTPYIQACFPREQEEIAILDWTAITNKIMQLQ